MTSFAALYARTFKTLGYALKPRDGVAESRVSASEKRLGIRLPPSLHDYYRVAGNERLFNCIHDRLLSPDKWFLDNGRLVFMEENQRVVFWGTLATGKPQRDPPVHQAGSGLVFRWRGQRHAGIQPSGEVRLLPEMGRPLPPQEWRFPMARLCRRGDTGQV